MRLFGRITVVGEYLMHDDTWGLVIPSRLFLSYDRGKKHPTYRSDSDEIRKLLLEEGFDTCTLSDIVFGNLPLGHGFSSSSLLACLHMDSLGCDISQELVEKLDSRIHGFPSSGVDASFCMRQKAGLYLSRQWRDIPQTMELDYSVALFPKEGEMPLGVIRERIKKRKRRLIGLADKFVAKGLAGEDDADTVLFDYSAELGDCDVYSACAQRFISDVLNLGVAAKGVGGLYDRAVLVYWGHLPKNPTLRHEIARIARSHGAEWMEMG